MSKKMEESKVDYSTPNFELDSAELAQTSYKEVAKEPVNEVQTEKPVKEYSDTPKVNVLRKEIITVRHIPRASSMVTNPKHILYGGMAENATRTFVVPRLRSGAFVNVLTKEEKAFLEEEMGLEYNTLSSIKTVNNYWADMSVRLTKQDNYLDLSKPTDYIKYKVLLANKDLIAPSLQALQDSPKATYQYVIISEGEESKRSRNNMNATMKCYLEYGKHEDDKDILRIVVETLTGKKTAPSVKLEFLQGQINDLIQSDSKMFLKVITDPYLNTKALIKKAVEMGVLINRDNHYYTRDGANPLCEANEESTLSNAAKYLNSIKHQDLLFAIQAKVKE